MNEIHRLNQEQISTLQDFYLQNLKDNSDKDKDAKSQSITFPFQNVCLPLINFLFTNEKIIFPTDIIAAQSYHISNKHFNQLMRCKIFAPYILLREFMFSQ